MFPDSYGDLFMQRSKCVTHRRGSCPLALQRTYLPHHTFDECRRFVAYQHGSGGFVVAGGGIVIGVQSSHHFEGTWAVKEADVGWKIS
jgi:hypothetical protein